MNDELHTELRQLLLTAGPHWTGAVETCLANSKVPALSIGGADFAVGILGERPQLPPTFITPCDRAGQPMVFLLQVDLARLTAVPGSAELTILREMPGEGVLTIFRSRQILKTADKDRKSFHMSFDLGQKLDLEIAANLEPDKSTVFGSAFKWTLDPLKLLLESTVLPRDTVDGLCKFASNYNRYNCGGGQFFGTPENLGEEKEICAFAASGISYDRIRAQDRHYSHLLETKDDWILLARLMEGKSNHVSFSDVLIRRDDLREGLFERAWLLSR